MLSVSENRCSVFSMKLYFLKATEIGMLRHRLSTEETNNKNLRHELDKKDQEIADLEEQLSMYETIVKAKNPLSSQQFASTPFHPGSFNNIRKGALDFKTPVSKYDYFHLW